MTHLVKIGSWTIRSEKASPTVAQVLASETPIGSRCKWTKLGHMHGVGGENSGMSAGKQ